MVIFTMPAAANVQTPKGSEITDKGGNVYVVEKVTEGSVYYTNYVKLKTKGK